MDAIKYMRALIGNDTAGVIAVETPIAEAVGIERPLRSGALPLIPIQFPFELCDALCSQVVIEPPGSDHSNLAKLAFAPGEFLGPKKQVVTATLHAALDNLLRRLFRSH